MRILVVEDEKHLNRIIAEALEDEGYSVDSCYNGMDGLDYALAAPYDVIVLDVMMPRMDGLEMLRRLRASGCQTPVLFLTARTAWPIGWPGWRAAGTTIWSSPLISGS